MSVAIYVRDAAFRRIGLIDDWQSLKITKVWNDAGRWTIDLNADTWGAGVLDEAHGISIDYNGVPLISGPIDDPKRSYEDASNRVVISGPDDNIWIKGRQTWPCAPDYSSATIFPDAANDVRSGNTDAVIKGYVIANCTTSGWDVARAIPRFSVADFNSNGSSVTSQARFDILNDVINSAALAGGDIGWQVTEQDNGLVFDTYVPEDVSSTVRFSVGLGNLAKFTYENQRPTCNWVIVAGQGEGTERVFVIAQDDESIAIWGRIEGPLIDRRDTNDPIQLAQSAAEALAKGAAVLSIDATVNDTDGIEFWKHWGLGRRMSISMDGVTYTDVVREVDVTWESADQPVAINPLIGSPGARRPAVPGLFAAQRANALRLSQLEARQ